MVEAGNQQQNTPAHIHPHWQDFKPRKYESIPVRETVRKCKRTQFQKFKEDKFDDECKSLSHIF
jgi:hypothetical protein